MKLSNLLKLKNFYFVPLCLCAFVPLFAQKKNAQYEYHIHRATSPIKIDGIVDEKAWENAETATDFYQVLPMDTSKAKVRTEVKMAYDDKNLYFVFINYDKLPGPYMVESLKRDFNFGKNDNDLLFIDTFDDQTNGFTFGSNAMGAQWDGLLYDGANANLSWENKWTMEVTYDDDKWIWEAAVPFKTLRYKKGITRWGINFSRLDLKTTEKSAWAPVPRQFPTASLAYTGTLVWDVPPPSAGTNISLIPYTTVKFSKDFEKGTKLATTPEIGIDAKVALTSSLNLDLTVNPDFSQVEVDRQQTNLDRFELFFPERRQFFLENGDLFTNFGYASIRPFFSRRIGLNAPIRYGARLSGKINKDWRIGVMDMQTGKNDVGLPAQNFGVIALQRRVFSRSNIAMMFVNKETNAFEELSAPDQKKYSRFNRNLGIEYNLASSNNVWRGKMMYLRSFSPNKLNDDDVLAGNLIYLTKHWNLSTQIERVGKSYSAEVGYVPRLNYGMLSPMAGRLFFPKSKRILSHGPSIGLTHYFDKNFTTEVENEKFVAYRVNFRNTSTAMIWVAHNYVKLLNPFDPTNFAGYFLAKDTEHRWNAFGTEFTSKPQSLLTYAFTTRYGGYYADGTRLRLTGDIGYRFQPYVALTMSANYNGLKFEDAEVLPKELKNKSYDFWLLGPRIDVTFTNKLFFTNFVQFNNQNKNVNLNTRLQWRYSPASDFFLVYTDNYLSDNLKVRNRALVFKFTYWWNV